MTRLRSLVLILGCLIAAITVVAGCGSSSSSTTSASTTSSAASTAAVKALQTGLATVGCYAGAIDGIDGSQTTAAVRNFQTASGLTADGIDGQKTAAALTAADRAGKIVCTSSGSTTSTSTTSTNSGGTGGGSTTSGACNPRSLAVSLNTSGSGAAGSSSYALTFTNGSGASCTVTGYPGVSAVSRSGAQLGNAAGRSTTTAATKVTLANGARATATLQITDVSNYTASVCGPTNAFGVKVYAPNSLTYHILTFGFRTCSKTGTTYMLVSPVAAG
jgi:hypothetical protein